MQLRSRGRVDAGIQGPHEQEGPTHLLQHIAEVLASHHRMLHLDHALGAEQPRRGVQHDLRRHGIIHRGRAIDLELGIDGAAMGGRHGPGHLHPAPGEVLGGLRGDGPHRGPEVGGVVDHIDRLAGPQLRGGAHHRVEDRELAGHEVLQLLTQVEHGRHRVDRRVGRRAVAAQAGEGGSQLAVAGHLGAGAHVDGAQRIGHFVDAPRHHRLVTGGIEQAVAEHLGSAPGDLLGRLEHEQHRARQVVAHPAQQFRRANHARHVQVMRTGVHAPVGRLEGLVGLLGHGQGVHVAAQQHGRPGPPTAQHRND